MDMVVTRDRRAGADLPGARGPSLLERYHNVRSASLQLATPLSVEDQCVQSMPDASPTKWHLAHTTWFFESMVLLPHVAGYRRYDPHFAHLFNSYYETLGPRHARALHRITRPGEHPRRPSPHRRLPAQSERRHAAEGHDRHGGRLWA